MNSHLRNSLLILLAITVLSGCAPKPWKNTVTALQAESGQKLFLDLQARQASCPTCLAADVKVIAENSLGHRGVSGYLQLSQPDAIKFIISNPFGQPLYAFAGTSGSYQLINTSDRLALEGSLNQFCQALQLPKNLASDSWPIWLTARLSVKITPLEIRDDREGKGLWFILPHPASNKKEHLLIDPTTNTLLSRVILEKEKEIIRLDYAYDGEAFGDCRQPSGILVSGLDFGTTANIEFFQVEELHGCQRDEFKLSTPPGYLQKTLP